MITQDEKIKSLKREIAFRKAVYPKWIQNSLIKQSDADHEIMVMQAILDDYLNQPPQIELPFHNQQR